MVIAFLSTIGMGWCLVSGFILGWAFINGVMGD